MLVQVAVWFRQYRVPVRAYLDEKNPPCVPPLKWWVVVIFVAKVSSEATITFRSLEGLTTLVSQQREGILKLASTLTSWFKASLVAGRQEAVDALDLQSNVLSEDRTYSIKLSDVEDMLADMGSFVIEAMDDIGADEKAVVVKSIATCCVDLLAGLASIAAERDSRNDAADSMPPVLPHQLVKLRGRDFAAIIRSQRDRLSARWGQQSIDIIEQEFEELRAACDREQSLKQVLDQCDSKTTFAQGWDYVQARFENLKKFCGGLATAFPGTSTVESDFSIVKWEKDDCRVGLTDFSLEGILHARQFEKMQSITL